MRRVIITCPSFNYKGGGVANYYKVFSLKQHYKAKLYFVGKDNISNNIFYRLFITFYQYVKFIFTISRFDTLVVNPSLTKNCILRDSIYVVIARAFQKKTVVFWRGFNDTFFEQYVRNHIYFMRFGLFRVDYTIVLGKKIYDKLHSIGCNTPYSVTTTILDRNLLRTDEKNFSDKKFTILFLARLTKAKGIIETLEAYEELKEKHSEINLIIAGDGPDYPFVKNYIESKNLQDVELIGDVRGRKKRECYEMSDLYLFPSYFEGMPNSVLEAMGMGLPVIVSDVGGISDFFESGKMGVLMKGHSKNEICEAFDIIYHDKRKLPLISNYNREYAANNFVDDIVVKKFENLLQNI